jgi:hypothetical protein
MFTTKHRMIALGLIATMLGMTSACTLVSLRDTTSPTIQNITTSSKVLVKSDCVPTSLTIAADIADNIRVQSVTLWYRIGIDQEFTSTAMKPIDRNQFTATPIAMDIPGSEYGVLESMSLCPCKG